MTHYAHLSHEQRKIIRLGALLHKPVAEIARIIGKHRSTVYRQIRRNTDPDPRLNYSDMLAYQLYMERRAKCGPRRKIQGPLKQHIEQ